MIKHMEVLIDSDGTRWLGWKTARSLGSQCDKVNFIRLERPNPEGRIVRDADK